MAFNQLQIIANGNYLDTYDNWDVALTYQIQDIVDITKKTTSFSKTILIPGTKTNNEFFENIFDVNIDLAITAYNPKISVPAQIRIGDQLVFDGNLQKTQGWQNLSGPISAMLAKKLAGCNCIDVGMAVTL